MKSQLAKTIELRERIHEFLLSKPNGATTGRVGLAMRITTNRALAVLRAMRRYGVYIHRWERSPGSGGHTAVWKAIPIPKTPPDAPKPARP